MDRITSRDKYDEAKSKMETLIAEATKLGLLEPEMDNEYTREIARLGSLMADYEDSYLNILPLRQKSPLIVCIENYFYAHDMRHKDGAKLLGINESQLSQIMCGRRAISMSLAKRLHQRMNIDANMILEYA